jgi:ABC-type amino acid transport substrate-binding protein
MKVPGFRRSAAGAVLACLLPVTAAVFAADHALAASPTMARIAERGEIRLGYVPDAPPMSFVGEDGQPRGYSIALCEHVVGAVREALKLPDLDVRFVALEALDERLDAVASGRVDLECGATTVTLSRRERVDFSLMTFITGGAVLSRRDDAIPSTTELAGRRIAVLRDTTTQDAVETFRDYNEMDIALVLLESNADGIPLLAKGEVDGLAGDRAMLVGQALQTGKPEEYVLTRNVFSFEPYALMLARGDTEFRLLVDSSLAELYRTARIRRLYSDWFGSAGLPMPKIVEAMYEFQAIAE